MTEEPDNLIFKQLHILRQLRRDKLLEDEVVIRIQEKITLDYITSLSVETSIKSMQDTDDRNMKDEIKEVKMPHIFVCYAHKDNESAESSSRWLNRLLEQLEPLNIQGQVKAWSDKDIEMGSDWHESIQATLQHAKAAVLLVSPAFLASKYIRNSELPILLKNAKDRGVKILPIILRHCLYEETKFKYPDPFNGPEELSLSSLQSANPPSKPLNKMEEYEQDETLLSVAKRLLRVIEQNQ
jgi:TIR domain